MIPVREGLKARVVRLKDKRVQFVQGYPPSTTSQAHSFVVGLKCLAVVDANVKYNKASILTLSMFYILNCKKSKSTIRICAAILDKRDIYF